MLRRALGKRSLERAHIGFEASLSRSRGERQAARCAVLRPLAMSSVVAGVLSNGAGCGFAGFVGRRNTIGVVREQADGSAGRLCAFVSYDEKPGIQAIGSVAPDLPPEPGHHPAISRDYEYRRHGTLTLMAGLDLRTGHVHSAVVDRHRSREFIAFLKQLRAAYPAPTRIVVILDNHSAHTSRETRAFLATIPNRFERDLGVAGHRRPGESGEHPASHALTAGSASDRGLLHVGGLGVS